jgi:hypothetical protein
MGLAILSHSTFLILPECICSFVVVACGWCVVPTITPRPPVAESSQHVHTSAMHKGILTVGLLDFTGLIAYATSSAGYMNSNDGCMFLGIGVAFPEVGMKQSPGA